MPCIRPPGPRHWPSGLSGPGRDPLEALERVDGRRGGPAVRSRDDVTARRRSRMTARTDPHGAGRHAAVPPHNRATSTGKAGSGGTSSDRETGQPGCRRHPAAGPSGAARARVAAARADLGRTVGRQAPRRRGHAGDRALADSYGAFTHGRGPCAGRAGQAASAAGGRRPPARGRGSRPPGGGRRPRPVRCARLVRHGGPRRAPSPRARCRSCAPSRPAGRARSAGRRRRCTSPACCSHRGRADGPAPAAVSL